MAAFALCFLSLMLPLVAWAHEAGRLPLAGSWNGEPWLLALLALSGALYALGVTRLWLRAGARRGISLAQAIAFTSGWLTLVAALVSPLDTLGARLFSAHMLQHELLMIVAAPLLVLGQPLAAWAWALPSACRRRIAGVTHWRGVTVTWDTLTQALIAWALHAIAVWLWHVPPLFEAALRSTAIHVAQHASFLATSLLFWWSVLGTDARRRDRGFALAYLFTTMMHTSALGALLTLAPTPWYSDYATSAIAFGIDPVEDQQVGGLLMWVPGSLAYLAATLVLLARVLAGRSFRRSSLRDMRLNSHPPV